MKHQIFISIKSGEITNRKAVATLFKSLSDGRYDLEISDVSRRSNQWNRYLHGILIPEFRKALNEAGYDEVKTDAQSKEIIKRMFLTRQVSNKETGEVLEYTQRTRDLSKFEASVLIDEVVKFAAENMNYVIPMPSEQTTLKYEK